MLYAQQMGADFTECFLHKVCFSLVKGMFPCLRIVFAKRAVSTEINVSLDVSGKH